MCHYGNFTGNSLLAGCGPNVKVKVIPIGTVTTDFKTEFVSAGINQTRHRVYLTVYCTMYVAAPLVGNEIIVNNGISRALVKASEDNKAALKTAGFLTRDPRMKERKKPGLKKARKAPQFSKR